MFRFRGELSVGAYVIAVAIRLVILIAVCVGMFAGLTLVFGRHSQTAIGLSYPAFFIGVPVAIIFFWLSLLGITVRVLRPSDPKRVIAVCTVFMLLPTLFAGWRNPHLLTAIPCGLYLTALHLPQVRERVLPRRPDVLELAVMLLILMCTATAALLMLRFGLGKLRPLGIAMHLDPLIWMLFIPLDYLQKAAVWLLPPLLIALAWWKTTRGGDDDDGLTVMEPVPSGGPSDGGEPVRSRFAPRPVAFGRRGSVRS